MSDEEKFLRDLLLYGTAVRTSDGKHVPLHDFRLTEEELEDGSRLHAMLHKGELPERYRPGGRETDG